MKLVNAFMLQNQRQALGTLEGLVKLVNTLTFMPQNQRHALGTLEGLVKVVNAFMLQNQRPNINLYRIDSKPNLYRIVLDV